MEKQLPELPSHLSDRMVGGGEVHDLQRACPIARLPWLPPVCRRGRSFANATWMLYLTAGLFVNLLGLNDARPAPVTLFPRAIWVGEVTSYERGSLYEEASQKTTFGFKSRTQDP